MGAEAKDVRGHDSAGGGLMANPGLWGRCASSRLFCSGWMRDGRAVACFVISCSAFVSGRSPALVSGWTVSVGWHVDYMTGWDI